MTSVVEPRTGARALRLLRSSAGIAIAMAVMNIGTYAFQMAAARLLGPVQYGAIASLMALLMVLSVVQLGLQATAARRIVADPEDVAAIEESILATTRRAAWGLGVLALVCSPLVWKLLDLTSVFPAILLALSVVPTTVMGGQAGVLQGERRWLPLSLMYLAVGIPRVVLGAGFLWIRHTEASGMLGVLIASCLPVVIGTLALRGHRPDPPANQHDLEVRRDARNEAIGSSMSLLAFTALANIDVIVARNVLPHHDAGLYAGGLIVTKAVLFLPQFAVVILFPSMSDDTQSRQAILRGLGFLGALGAVCVAGAWLLKGVAVQFIGGSEYSGVTDKLWLFAIIGGLLSLLQLLVYGGLAKRGRTTKYIVAVSVAALIGFGLLADSVIGLALTVAAIDAATVVVLMALHLLQRPTPAPAD
ncbi:MAG: polysaccharide biosynthesis protein [Nocardioidaceae bacterium]|nr:polysaccharide biosynthesis protein [Nocardioidaceae bacterium]MCL2613700.1 polysaccharide biosynthesis protein [Nocardioidaceae bacterium]